MFFKSYKENNKGFTLVELIVVLLIISIIVAITLVSLSQVIGKAKEVEAVTTLKTIHNWQQEEYLEQGKFADSLESLDIPSISPLKEKELSTCKEISQKMNCRAGKNYIFGIRTLNKKIEGEKLVIYGAIARESNYSSYVEGIYTQNGNPKRCGRFKVKTDTKSISSERFNIFLRLIKKVSEECPFLMQKLIKSFF